MSACRARQADFRCHGLRHQPVRADIASALRATNPVLENHKRLNVAIDVPMNAADIGNVAERMDRRRDEIPVRSITEDVTKCDGTDGLTKIPARNQGQNDIAAKLSVRSPHISIHRVERISIPRALNNGRVGLRE
jgi:hypothetical protein